MNKTINDLEQITTVSTSDELPIYSEGETKKVNVGNLKKEVYSTEETLTNKVWIDGKPIYRKVVDFGALPNNTNKTVPHNISNLGTVIKIDCVTSKGDDWMPLPVYYSNSNGIGLSLTTTDVFIQTYLNKTAYTSTYVTIEYTKTTD